MENNKNSMDMLLTSVYSDKKLTKAQIRSININLVIDTLDADKLNLRKLSILLVALTKVLQRRMKSLLEDSNHLYQLLSNTTKRSPRAPSSKNITLEIQNNRLFINDEEIDFGEETIVQELENSILEQSFANPGFEVDFGDNISIEQVRDSTLLSVGDMNAGSVIFSDLNVNIKRRKVIEDRTIEISETIFKTNLRTVQDILIRTQDHQINLSETLVKVDKKIEMFLDSLKQSFVPVEQQRQQDFDADFSAPEVSFNPIDNSSDHQKIENSAIFSVFDEFSTLSKQFIFNLLIQQLSKEEKAYNFLKLLDLANEGRILPFQSESFGVIDCHLND